MDAPRTKNATPHWQQSLLWYSFPALDKYADRLVHGFSTRLGGVSQGYYQALNLGLGRGDEPAHLLENYRRFGEAVGFDAEKTVISSQTHGIDLRLATAADAGKGLFQERDYHDIDGLITSTANLPLITSYADCTPLLFYAPDQHIIANSHAGWRGTAKGMAKATVDKLTALHCDPQQLVVVIGPSASPSCYEVGADTAAHFTGLSDELGPVAQPIEQKPGKFLLDMWRANQIFLLSSGVKKEHIHVAGLCTISNPEIFYSHRVMGTKRGSLVAAVMLR